MVSGAAVAVPVPVPALVQDAPVPVQVVDANLSNAIHPTDDKSVGGPNL